MAGQFRRGEGMPRPHVAHAWINHRSRRVPDDVGFKGIGHDARGGD